MLLLSAFLLGVAGSLHCMGMCGPIAMALPLNRNSVWTQLVGLFLYNLGRVFTYSLLGFVFGTIGFSLDLYRFLQFTSILIGVAMIAIAWRRQLLKHIEFSSSRLQLWIFRNMGKLLASGSPLKLFGIGALNGLLPCGMIFIALSTALLAENAMGSAFTMTAFGLGSLPAMMMIGFVANQFSFGIRQQLNRVFPYVMTVIGLMVILRGANLGIPYLSPKLEQTTQKEHVSGKDPKSYQVICHTADSKKSSQ
jgi:sulfite exporter TauE/SafE